jgi:carbon-monoxide dehydrogenase large subunit
MLAAMSMPEHSPEFRPQLIGARVRRREDPRLLTGQATYVDDRRIHGLLHIAFRRSDQSHARIAGIDCRAALDQPGVVAVFTSDDLAGVTNPIRATSRMAAYQSTELLGLARDKVRHVGEPVVAVVATSRYLAEDALAHIELELEPLDAIVDVEQAAGDGAPLLHDEMSSNVLAERTFARGDVAAALAGAAVRVGARFRVRRKTPVAIEARVYAAEYDRGTRSLTLHSSTQVPGIIRDALADILDMPGHRLRVVAPEVGGGFGAKASLYSEEIAVAAIARELGRPVKWTSDRVEDLTSTSQAFDEIIDAELALDGDGRITGLRADVIGDVGAYSIYPWTACIEPVQVVSFLPGPYRVPDYEARVRAVATSKPPGGPYRGVGRPISTFVMERLLDMASRKLSIDPREIRLRNFVAEDEFPYKTASGIVWDRSSFTECLTRACDEIGYDALLAEQAAARAAGRWMGIGIASYAELTGIGSRIAVAPGMPINTGTESSTVRIDSTGAVTASFGVASQGQGLETSLAQIVAEELGARIEDIEILQGDSALSAHGTGTYASRSAVLAGGAAILAARAVRDKVIRAASHILEAAPADIATGNGNVFVAGTDRRMTIRELAKAVYSQMGSLPKDMRDDMGNLEATKVYDPYTGTATSATHIAVVEVDPETFEPTILRYVVVEDCGRVINPMIADGQAHGGVAQGIGAALFEEMIHDSGGQVLTANLADYVVPTAPEIPTIDVVHLEAEPPNTVGGFRGLGEGGTIGAPAAIANALSDALSPLGIEIDELPATPQRLFRLIESARARGRAEES